LRSTYASIIGTIIDRAMPSWLASNALVPTFTFAVTALLEKHFDLVNTSFTSRMEQTG